MSLTKIELQKILRKYGLSVDGKRPELITRLKEHLSTAEENEAEAGPDNERLDRIEEQLSEMREQQEEQTRRILQEIRVRVSANPSPRSGDETSSQLSSPPPSTGNNNFPSPMPREETVVMRMRRQKAMSKISALAQEKDLPETDSDEEI